MNLRLFLFIVALSSCGRSLSESTLQVSVLRTGARIDSVWVALEHSDHPCGRFDGTVMLNGIELEQRGDGTGSRGTASYGVPLLGCAPPSFALNDRNIEGPLDVRVEWGGEVVTLHSESVLTLDFTAPSEVRRGELLRISPSHALAVAPWYSGFDIEGDVLELRDGDDSETRLQKALWSLWDDRIEGDAIVASVPLDMPLGSYTWSLAGLSAPLTPERCEGVASCNVDLRLESHGVVTVR